MIRSVLLLVSLAACAPGPAAGDVIRDSALPVQAPPQATDSGYVDVSGTGVVTVESDRAHISFAVETQAVDAQTAVRLNADTMTATIAALRQANPEVEIETHGYSLQPLYHRPDPDTGERRIAGYTALNHVRVTVNDIDAVGSLIDAATGAGANRISALRFGSSDLEAARREALRLAVLDAREQAETIAEALGVPLGPALEVRGNNPRPPQDRQTRVMAMAAESATPVEAGDQEVRATVSIRYRLGGE